MMKNKIQSNYRESSWMFDLNSYNDIDFVSFKLKSLNNCPFMVKDIIGFIKYNDDIVIPSKPIQIHYINPYSFKDTKELKEYANTLASTDDDKIHILMATSFVSKDEFSPDEYCETEDESNTTGKKLLPYDEIIDRQNKFLEEAGFVNINNIFGQYETQRAFIFNDGSDLIKTIIGYKKA